MEEWTIKSCVASQWANYSEEFGDGLMEPGVPWFRSQPSAFHPHA